jgi:hypothetical protein
VKFKKLLWKTHPRGLWTTTGILEQKYYIERNKKDIYEVCWRTSEHASTTLGTTFTLVSAFVLAQALYEAEIMKAFDAA